MRWITQNKGHAAALVLAAITLVVFAALLIQGLGSGAEAVIGDVGNLGTTSGGKHPHDLSAGTVGVRAQSEDEICIFCHTPHRALVEVPGADPAKIFNAPLWNHELSSQTYTVKTPYAPIGNAAFSNTIGLFSTPLTQPDGASRLCLSCHDGTVSIGAVIHRYGYAEASNDISMVDACIGTDGLETAGLGMDLSTPSRFGALTSACRAYRGTDLTDKHVVSVPMNADLLQDTLYNCVVYGGSSIATTRLQYPWQSAYGTKVLLRPTGATYKGNGGVTYPTGSMPGSKYKTGYSYGVQCSTCHDPHYWKEDLNSTIGDVVGERMLVETFNNLCTACHTSSGCI